MNELANLCERTGADIDLVRKGIGSDPRVGQQFLFSGVGYGGSCFPKDVKALIKTSHEHEYEFKILRAVDDVNERQKRVLLWKISKYFGKSLVGKTIAVWGLSFKPQTDDMREAPSLAIINGLLEMGARVRAHDPIAMARARTIFQNRIEYVDKALDTLKSADALVIVTEWNEFRTPDFGAMKANLKKPVIFDGRNIYDPKELRALGFTYFGIGRSSE
jgi:UDPglucose 6-dehydrogenase